MDKFESKILYILLIGILLCSVQAIAAADVGDTDNVFDLSSDIENIETESIDDAPILSEEAVADDSDVIEAPTDEETLSADAANFTELGRTIDRADRWSTLELDTDYTKQSGESRIEIDKSITIDGKGHTIDGNGISGGIFITSNSYYYLDLTTTITLKNINFVNSNGSAIFGDNHRVNIYNCTFTNCTSTTNGGAIYRDNAVFDQIQRYSEIIDCNFTNCSATNGGAIYNYHSTVDIDNCVFTDNKAVTGSAIYNDINTLSVRGMDISNTEILENQARATSLVLDTNNPWWTNTFNKFIVTFEGRDNLLNGIYAPNGLHINFTNVTYYSADGEAQITDDSPSISNREAGIDVTLCITTRDGTPVMNITKKTNSTGQTEFNSTQIIDELQLEPGEYTAYVVHEEDAYYTKITSSSMDFTCARGYYHTNVSDEEISGYPTEEVEVTFDVNRVTGDQEAVKNGTVYVIIDEEKYSGTVENGKATIKVPLPSTEGEFNFTVYYDGTETDYYWNSTGNLKITVEKLASEVTVTPEDIKVGDDETINFTVTEGIAGSVNYIIKDADGNTVDSGSVAIEDGSFTVKDLAAGDYNVTLSYEGDVKYNASEASNTFTVTKRDVKVEVLTDVIGKQGDVITVTIKVTDSETGEPVNGGTVEYTIDFTNKLGLAVSITLSATVGEDGTATVDVELSGEPGTYAAKATYSGNEKYNAGEADDEATVTESPDDPSDEPSEDPSDDSSDDSDDSTDDSTDESTDDSTEESADEPKEAASKSVAAESLATGNPIAMLLMVLMALVSTISFRRQK